jgi:hypothetical protein
VKDAEHHDTPHDALIKALERVENMESVLIIYEGKPGLPAGSFDSDLSVSDALYLVEIFKHWLLSHAVNTKD